MGGIMKDKKKKKELKLGASRRDFFGAGKADRSRARGGLTGLFEKGGLIK